MGRQTRVSARSSPLSESLVDLFHLGSGSVPRSVSEVAGAGTGTASVIRTVKTLLVQASGRLAFGCHFGPPSIGSIERYGSSSTKGPPSIPARSRSSICGEYPVGVPPAIGPSVRLAFGNVRRRAEASSTTGVGPGQPLRSGTQRRVIGVGATPIGSESPGVVGSSIDLTAEVPAKLPNVTSTLPETRHAEEADEEQEEEEVTAQTGRSRAPRGLLALTSRSARTGRGCFRIPVWSHSVGTPSVVRAF